MDHSNGVKAVRKKGSVNNLRNAATTVSQAVNPLPESASRVVGATLTVLSGGEAGRYLFIGPEGGILGRDDSVDYPFADGAISRQHARLSLQGHHYMLTDMGSLNGTFVDGDRIQGTVVLPANCRIQLATDLMLQFASVDELGADAVEKLSNNMLTDPLTGTGNRYHLQQRLDQELNFSRRHNTAVGVLLLDLDFFKSVNDNHGHLTGDKVLTEVGATLLEAVRAEDMVFRYGGEEFCVLVRGLDEQGMVGLGERIRSLVELLTVRDGTKKVKITISVGVAVQVGESPDEQSLLLRADQALYRAKEGGRNRVVLDELDDIVMSID